MRSKREHDKEPRSRRQRVAPASRFRSFALRSAPAERIPGVSQQVRGFVRQEHNGKNTKTGRDAQTNSATQSVWCGVSVCSHLARIAPDDRFGAGAALDCAAASSELRAPAPLADLGALRHTLAGAGSGDSSRAAAEWDALASGSPLGGGGLVARRRDDVGRPGRCGPRRMLHDDDDSLAVGLLGLAAVAADGRPTAPTEKLGGGRASARRKSPPIVLPSTRRGGRGSHIMAAGRPNLERS
jgi:hypothetical protein